MSGPKPPVIPLSDAERQGLEKLVKAHTVAQQKALRGRLVLLAATGKNNPEIAGELHVGVDMVRLWRHRWLELQPIPLGDLSIEERLEDLPRPGAPAHFTADQICQMEQFACAKPEKAGRPISQWTGREIAAELMQRGIVERISPRHAARLLKKGGSNHT